MTDTRQCAAGCGEDVTWLRNDRTGKIAPINREPSDDGNVTCDWFAGTYHVLTKKEVAEAAQPGLFGADRTPLFKTHFATCPRAGRFRSCRKCHKTPCRCAAMAQSVEPVAH